MSIQSISFGKTAVMTCTIKNAETKKRQEATLYKMNPHNREDQRDISYSKQTRCIAKNFEADTARIQPHYDYYLLTNDKTKEVISCAQTSRHYRANNTSYSGVSTLIDEMKENEKYVRGGEPLLAYLAHKSFSQYDKCIASAVDLEEAPSLKGCKFTQLKNGDWVIPEKRYHMLIDQAEKRNDISFIG